MVVKHKLITADELLMMPDDGKRYELIRGVLSEKVTAGDPHSIVVSRIDTALSNYSDANDYGETRTGEPGYRLDRNPDTVRAPRRGLDCTGPRTGRHQRIPPTWLPTLPWRSSRPAIRMPSWRIRR